MLVRSLELERRRSGATRRLVVTTNSCSRVSSPWKSGEATAVSIVLLIGRDESRQPQRIVAVSGVPGF